MGKRFVFDGLAQQQMGFGFGSLLRVHITGSSGQNGPSAVASPGSSRLALFHLLSYISALGMASSLVDFYLVGSAF
ncbi:hypothetical protein Dimus_014481 [Dionaea muscipula]